MAAAVAFFCWAISLCYIPQKGFSGLVQFGDSFVERQLPEVRALNPYVMEHSMGYDGQFYAQLAVRPDPADPEVQRAMDRRSSCPTGRQKHDFLFQGMLTPAPTAVVPL